MTGAGRGSAAKVLEKLGYYVVDNIPPSLIKAVVDTAESSEFDKLAVVVDARSREFFARLVDELESLRKDGTGARILYLEASDEVLVRRQEAARRPHPLSREGRLMDGFDRERELLRRIRGRADLVVDTTNLNVHQLGQRIRAAFEDADDGGRLRASVMSFGFKYGLPIDADMVADLRFLPNPYWVPELRPLSGLDEPVRDYVRKQPLSEDFLEKYDELVALLTDGYLREDQHFLTIALGCTGGRHRSVAMAEALGERLEAHGVRVLVVHRDLGRE
ncbi:RNase adapter RapZ [Aeromicrobium panaciterrae]|uniref:RNase adapter RapZ n=1 Tax=Aeromicrobium panaciterrae TaxID=363861 RepID=UPI0031DCA8D7